MELWWEKKHPQVVVNLDEHLSTTLRSVKNTIIGEAKMQQKLMEKRFNARLRRMENDIMAQVVGQQDVVAQVLGQQEDEQEEALADEFETYMLEDAKSREERAEAASTAATRELLAARAATREAALKARIQKLERDLLEVDEERLRLKKHLECHICIEDFAEARRSGGKSIPCNHFGLKRCLKISNPEL